MTRNEFPNRWKLWAAAVFVAGLSAGALAIELISHAGRAGISAAASPGEKESTGNADSVAGRVKLEAAAQKNIGLVLERVQLRQVAQTVQANGTVGPNETRVAHVRPIARGRIEKVYVRLGDRVRAGQPLVLYDNVELGETTGEFVSAIALLEKTEAEAQVAKRSVERAKALVDVGALAKAELDRRSTEYTSALANIESQKAVAAKIEEKLHRYGLSEEEITKLHPRGDYHREASHGRLTAPFDGIIVKSAATDGESVGPEDELFTIADLSTVWVQADIYEKDIHSIRQGQEARIVTDSYPDRVFAGKITYVSDFLDPKTRTAKARCEVPNPDGLLKLDMFATIQLPTPRGRDALMVPAAAIQRVNERNVAFVKVSGTEFQLRNVETAGPAEGWVEVTSGLQRDEVVAAHGSFFLKSTLLRSEIGGDE